MSSFSVFKATESTQLDSITLTLEEAEKPLEVIAKKDDPIIRLMTIPRDGR